jgi:hypothetical protein
MPALRPPCLQVDLPHALCYSFGSAAIESATPRFPLISSSQNPNVAVTYRIAPDERVVYLTTTGEATFAEWRGAVLSALSDPDYRKGFNFLSDRRDQADVPDTGFVKAAAAFLREHSAVIDGCRWATVAGRDALYGMARMFSTFSEGTCIRVAAFRDYEDALRWLTGGPPEA